MAYSPKYTAFTSKGARLSCHFKILDSISSKLMPFVSGTEKIMNKSDRVAIAPKRRKRFSAPRNSCSRSQHRLLTPRAVTSQTKFKMTIYLEQKLNTKESKEAKTFSGENAKVTTAFEAKLVRTARLIPLPLVRSGKTSDTISQLIGPNDICNTNAI